MKFKLFSIGVMLLCGAAAYGQESASLTGSVLDPSGAFVPGATVTLSDLRRGSSLQAQTNASGLFVFESIQPGEFGLEASKNGFKKFRMESLRLGSRDRVTITLKLEIAAQDKAEVTVRGDIEVVSTDLSSAVAVERDYAENLPVNGRNIQQLLLFTPGVISAAGGRAGADDLNVNGLRANANYYMVDGVSANRGATGRGGMAGAGAGRRGGGMAGGFGRVGSTGVANDLMALEALEQVRVQTSTFAPEFGRTPGAQVSLASRAGSNLWSGSAFFTGTNPSWMANDWFANRQGIERAEMQHRNFGGSFGGAIIENQTFFFASYEGLRSKQPETSVNFVPTLAARQAATAALRPYLEAFPVPNSQAIAGGAGQFTAAFSNPFDSDSYSLRLDHNFNQKVLAFVRGSYMPYKRTFRGQELIAPNVLSTADSKPWTLTGAIVWTPTATVSNDLRFNLSDNSTDSATTMDSFGGAKPLSISAIIPSSVRPESAEFRLGVLGLSGYAVAGSSTAEQQQWNLVNNFTKIEGSHSIKLGIDFRRISPTYIQRPYSIEATFNGLQDATNALLSGVASTATVSSHITRVEPVLNNFSFFAQDSWKADDKTTVTYGLRWDINPAPGVRNGSPPFALASDGVTVSRFTPLYPTRLGDVAPRFGMAHQLSDTPGWEAILRMGIGVFYDLGYGTTMAAFNGVPYTSQRNLVTPAFPLTASDLAPPVLPSTRPYGQLSVADPFLRSPRVLQWNISLEQTIAQKQVLTMSYIGTQGRRLMLTSSQPSFTADYDILRLTGNGADSDYHGVQLQYRRRFSADLLAQVSYTYSHSIDTSSNDANRGGFATLFGDERGSSDFDVRHNLAASASYRLPAARGVSGPIAKLINDWWLDSVVFARTALPMDVLTVSTVTSNTTTGTRGTFAQVRPNYTGQPVWVNDPAAPGGRRLNRDAFLAPTGFQQGNLGRNVIRGFPALQIDLSLRKQVTLGERARLQVFAQAFNILNHPNFANPSPQEGANLASPGFGFATRMLNQAGGGGAGSMYRTGGPRSMQVGLRVTF